MSTNSNSTHNKKYLLLTLIVFLLVTAPSVLKRSIWTDEAYSILLLSGQMLISYPTTVITPKDVQHFFRSSATFGETLHALIRDDVHPPVYFLLAKSWSSIFGQSLLSLRGMSVLAGLTTIFVFFHFLKLSSSTLANIATPIFAFSTGVLHYSTEVRHYIFSLLGLVITMYLMARVSIARNNMKNTNMLLMPALIAATSLTVLTNYLAIFSIGVCYIWFIGAQSNRRSGLICGFCSLLLISMWLPFLFEYRPDVATHASGFGALSQEFHSFEYHSDGSDREIGWQGLPRQMYLILQGTFGSLFIASHIEYPTTLHWIGRIFLSGLIVIGALSIMDRPRKSEADSLTWLFVLLTLAPGIGALILYVLFTKQLYGLRYMMLAAPGLAALGGIGIFRLYQQNAKFGTFALSAGLVLLLSVANWGYTSSYYQGKTIYREFSSLLQQQALDSSLVIAGTGPMSGNTASLLYELPEDVHVIILRPDTDVSTVLASTELYDHVWLVRIRELTGAVEDELAESLEQSWKRREDYYQIEHFEKSNLVHNSGSP